jgi:hypothetical protein
MRGETSISPPHAVQVLNSAYGGGPDVHRTASFLDDAAHRRVSANHWHRALRRVEMSMQGDCLIAPLMGLKELLSLTLVISKRMLSTPLATIREFTISFAITLLVSPRLDPIPSFSVWTRSQCCTRVENSRRESGSRENIFPLKGLVRLATPRFTRAVSSARSAARE